MNLKKESGRIKTSIIILLVVVLLILIGLGVFAYLYIKTDFLKSNEDLFWKYMSQNSEAVNILRMDIDEQYNNTSYSEKTEIDFSMRDEQLAKLNPMEITINTKNDTETKRTISNINAVYNDEKFLEFEYLKNDNQYSIKNSEIANGFIVLENNNLKEFAEKINLGLEEIPDEINIPSKSTFLSITEEEKKYLINTYYKIIKQNINKNKYEKREKIQVTVDNKNYTANEYSIILTKKEFKNLLLSLLENLKTDSMTLNLISTKMKNIDKNSKYSNINDLNKEISYLIEEIKKIETTDEEYIKFMVYESNGKTIKTSIELINNRKISFSYNKEENKLILTSDYNNDYNIEKQNNDYAAEGSYNYNGIEENFNYNLQEIYNNFKWNELVVISKSEQQEKYLIANIKLQNGKEINIELKNTKIDNGYKFNAKFYINGNIITVKSERIISIQEDIPLIKDNTNIILNKLEKEKLNILLNKLVIQVSKLIENKLEIMEK